MENAREAVPWLRGEPRAMAVLCFVVDVSSLSATLLKAVKNLHVILGAAGPFNLREFHHAVSNLPLAPANSFNEDVVGECRQVSALLKLLRGDDCLLTWAPEDTSRKVIFISSHIVENVKSFRQTLTEAADHFVTIEFVEIQPTESLEYFLDNHWDSEPKKFCKLSEFAISVSEFENSTWHPVPSDAFLLLSLVKRLVQELLVDSTLPIEGVLVFGESLGVGVNEVYCSFQPAIMQLADRLAPCQTCKCHGQLVETSLRRELRAFPAVCPVSGQELDTEDLPRSGVRIGAETVLFLPSFMSPRTLSASSGSRSGQVSFKIITCIEQSTLSEGLLFGLPYVVLPSSEMEIELTASLDNTANHINEQIFAALLGDLQARDSALLCSSEFDIETQAETSFLCFYILLPGQIGSFLAKRIAASEELLPALHPPEGWDHVAVADPVKSTVSACLAKIGTRTYNPLEHLRGCHSKLNCLVKESLRYGSTMATSRTLYKEQCGKEQASRSLVTSSEFNLDSKEQQVKLVTQGSDADLLRHNKEQGLQEGQALTETFVDGSLTVTQDIWKSPAPHWSEYGCYSQGDNGVFTFGSPTFASPGGTKRPLVSFERVTASQQALGSPSVNRSLGRSTKDAVGPKPKFRIRNGPYN